MHFTNVETGALRGSEACLRSHSQPMVICPALKKKTKKSLLGLSQTKLPHTKRSEATHDRLGRKKAPLSGPTSPLCPHSGLCTHGPISP